MVYGRATGNKNAIFSDEGILNTQLANDERANLSERQLNRLMQDTDFSDVAVKATEFSQSLQNVEREMKEVNADSENYKEQMNNLAYAIDLARDKLSEFDALNIASDDMIDSISNDLTSLETKIRANGKASDDVEKEIAELIGMINRLGKSAKDMNPQAFRQAMLGAGDLVDKKKGNVDFVQTQANRAEENALDAQKNIDSQQQIKGILDTLNAVQQLTFA
jgi:chromosome segregation ATPase